MKKCNLHIDSHDHTLLAVSRLRTVDPHRLGIIDHHSEDRNLGRVLTNGHESRHDTHHAGHRLGHGDARLVK